MRFSLTRHHRDDGLVTLAPAGDVDMDAVDALGSALQDTLHTPDDRIAVVVDLARVTFLDCTGIGVLVAGRVARSHRSRRHRDDRRVATTPSTAGVYASPRG